MIILYTYINEERHQDLLDRYLNLFSEDFKKEILKYRRWEDAQLSLLGRILLKKGLHDYYDIHETDIGLSDHNKPFLKGQNVHFNISHSKNLVVCAIADFPIGIDVEFPEDKIHYKDFQFQMTADEFQSIENADDKTAAFFTYWTKKEAVIKAHGSGMMIPLDSFEILDDECIIEDKKFFTKGIFIDKNYYSCIASGDIGIKNVVPVLEYIQI